MNTSKLIDVLSANLEPVEPRALTRTVSWALVIATAAAFCVMLTTVGLRPGVVSDDGRGFLALKLVFAVSLVGGGVSWLVRSMQPAREMRAPFWLLAFPFAALVVAGAVDLLRDASVSWSRMLFGTQWAMCVACIPLFALIPFAMLIWAARTGAPTDLARTGAMAGLVAGALGAIAYAFHCPDDFLPFVAMWY
ncbi:MAG: NrsF family protein, partial [Vicinamibacterales bacterium]